MILRNQSIVVLAVLSVLAPFSIRDELKSNLKHIGNQKQFIINQFQN